MRVNRLACAVLLCLTVTWASGAEAAERQRPAALKRMVDCRLLSDLAARADCYDREVAAFDAAEARKDLVVVDRQELRKTRRSLFGLALPDLGMFGDESPDDERITRVESKIKRAVQNPYRKWILTLDDGSVWAQTDSRNLTIDPQTGHEVKIRKAALGSYLANVHGQVGIRVERLR